MKRHLLKITSLTIFIFMITVLTACQGKEAVSSIESEAEIKCSLRLEESSQEEASEETEKETSYQKESDAEIAKEQNNTLSSPVIIASEALYPDAYLQYIKENINGTQKEIELFKKWINGLSADSITKIYGETAYLDYNKPIDAALEDSRLILDKLKAASDFIYPMDEEALLNPYTGGGFIIAIHSDDGNITEITFNGGWLMAANSEYEKRAAFNIENTDGQKLCYEINDIFYNMIKSYESTFYPKLYEGEKVTAVYAEDRKNHVMVPYLREEYDQLINIPKEDLTETDSDYAVVIFTDDDKNYLYLKDNNSSTLLDCKGVLEQRDNYHPGWLIHFDPAKVTDAIGTDDREKIEKLSEFLKEEVIVERESETVDGPVNPSMTMGDFFFKMKFASGTEYHIMGTDYMDGSGILSIYTSDLDKTVKYKLKGGIAPKITEFINRNFG